MDGESGSIVSSLVAAIVNHRTVRLVYRRAKDGVTSIHEVASIDIQPGDRHTLVPITKPGRYRLEVTRNDQPIAWIVTQFEAPSFG